MTWRWGPFLIYCCFLLFTGWLSGFLMPGWLPVLTGGVIGLIAGVQRWFDAPPPPGRRRF